MSKLYTRPTEERLRAAAPLRGRRVRVVQEPVRGSSATRELVGELVSVAHTYAGTGGYLLVLRVVIEGRRHDEAVSLATVVSIEEVAA